jgi:hypothetical protein
MRPYNKNNMAKLQKKIEIFLKKLIFFMISLSLICGKFLITLDDRKEEEMDNNQEEEVQNSVDRI